VHLGYSISPNTRIPKMLVPDLIRDAAVFDEIMRNKPMRGDDASMTVPLRRLKRRA
jgi:NH3-dependent NAD+ synthetase